MSTMVFINLPVRDLERSKAFYTALGFSINPQFTDHNAACVVISDTIFVMALTESYFTTFTKKPVADATKSTGVIIALSRDSRAHVDETADKALASGGSASMDPMDHGFMYMRSFQDPDGHLWELTWMDMAAMQDG